MTFCIHQAAKSNSAGYGALLELFECIENILRGPIIHIKMTLTPAMSETVTKIIAELLSVLTLAIKQVNEGRLSMFSPFVNLS